MAAALTDAMRQQPYSDQQSSPGGGAGGGDTPLIPPGTELKLLRGLQADVFQQTRDLAAQQPANPDEAERRDHDAIELSTQQRDLSALGEQMLHQKQPGPRGPANHEPTGTE